MMMFSGTLGEAINGVTGCIVYNYNFEDGKENREYIVMINIGNIFAKKINLGDNCFSFNDFLNKYGGFIHSIEMLTIAEKVRFFKNVLQLINVEGFFQEVLMERHD